MGALGEEGAGGNCTGFGICGWCVLTTNGAFWRPLFAVYMDRVVSVEDGGAAVAAGMGSTVDTPTIDSAPSAGWLACCGLCIEFADGRLASKQVTRASISFALHQHQNHHHHQKQDSRQRWLTCCNSACLLYILSRNLKEKLGIRVGSGWYGSTLTTSLIRSRNLISSPGLRRRDERSDSLSFTRSLAQVTRAFRDTRCSSGISISIGAPSPGATNGLNPTAGRTGPSP